MSEITKHDPGTFCWPELATTDQSGAKHFYGELFGWTAVDQPIGPGGVYTIYKLNGKDVAAAHGMMPDQAAHGVPPHWISYISVENADESLAKAASLGGKVVGGPFDVMDAGRMGILQDPTGALFAVWKGNKTIGVQVLDQSGALVWTELLSSNADVSRDFYTRLFGWGVQLHQMGPMTYTVFLRGEKPAGGMMQTTPDMGQMPSHWLPYFGVDDVDASTKMVEGKGGHTIIAPADVPGVGRFSLLKDPQHATFGIFRFARG